MKAWPWLRRGLTGAFFAVVAWLLWINARDIEWARVWQTLLALPDDTLALAALLAVSSHALFSCFDLLGRRYTGHTLPTRTVMGVNFISYAFNLSLGSLVGGVAFRYRMYSRLGLGKGVITRIVTTSMLTNWLGYTLLAGLAFLLWPLDLPDAWGIGSDMVRVAGAVLLCIAGAYLALCAWRGGHTWHLRAHSIAVPALRMALLQMAMSSTNWLLMGALVWTLLQGHVDFATTLQVLLIAAVAGVLAHVPAGLGVLEAVFVGILSARVPMDELLAAMVAYRAIYYVLPLVAAALGYATAEARLHRRKLRARQRAHHAHQLQRG